MVVELGGVWNFDLSWNAHTLGEGDPGTGVLREGISALMKKRREDRLPWEGGVGPGPVLGVFISKECTHVPTVGDQWIVMESTFSMGTGTCTQVVEAELNLVGLRDDEWVNTPTSQITRWKSRDMGQVTTLMGPHFTNTEMYSWA